jgi:hypothetical protein
MSVARMEKSSCAEDTQRSILRWRVHRIGGPTGPALQTSM